MNERHRPQFEATCRKWRVRVRLVRVPPGAADGLSCGRPCQAQPLDWGKLGMVGSFKFLGYGRRRPAPSTIGGSLLCAGGSVIRVSRFQAPSTSVFVRTIAWTNQDAPSPRISMRHSPIDPAIPDPTPDNTRQVNFHPSSQQTRNGRIHAFSLLALLLAASCGGTNTGARASNTGAFAGTWACTVTQSFSAGGSTTASVLDALKATSDTAITSTEVDDSGAFPCGLAYTVTGDTATVAAGSSCTVDGTVYMVDGTLTLSEPTLNVDLQYGQSGASSVGGTLTGTCTKQ